MSFNQPELYLKKRLVLRLVGINKIFSLEYNQNWTIAHLKSLLSLIFKEEIKNNSKINIIYCGQYIENSEETLKNIISVNDTLPQLLIIFKTPNNTKKNNENLKKPKNQFFESLTFSVIEKFNLLNYKNNVNSNGSFDYFLKKLPLFHPQLKHRYSEITEKSQDTYENKIIENFPIRNYFQFGLMIKLFLMLLLFGFGMKGFNFPIFIALLVIYYW